MRSCTRRGPRRRRLRRDERGGSGQGTRPLAGCAYRGGQTSLTRPSPTAWNCWIVLRSPPSQRRRRIAAGGHGPPYAASPATQSRREQKPGHSHQIRRPENIAKASPAAFASLPPREGLSRSCDRCLGKPAHTCSSRAVLPRRIRPRPRSCESGTRRDMRWKSPAGDRLTRRTSARRYDQSFRLINQVINIQPRHAPPTLPRSRNG